MVFADVPLNDGENTLTAETANAEDTITLNGVQEHNAAYDLPDVVEALNAGNWFLENDDELPEVEDGYSLELPMVEILANDACYRIVKGWIMANERIALDARLSLVTRLPNWDAMYGAYKIHELNLIKNNTTQEDVDKLDKMLRRIKRT